MEEAILAGGCFWGVEAELRTLPGIVDTEAGYIGGETKDPTYNDVKTGKTGHAEAVWIKFDPKKLSYARLLERFFQTHDPTTPNRQGNDVGSQYRSVIFYTSPQQKAIAEDLIDRINASGKWPGPVVTQLEEAPTFYPAEDYHQDYLEKHPFGYSCHFPRADWVLNEEPASAK